MEKSRFSFLIALTRQLEMALHERDFDHEVDAWLSSAGAALEELLGLGDEGAEDDDSGPDEDGDGGDDDAGSSDRSRSDVQGAKRRGASARMRGRLAGGAADDDATRRVSRARTPVHDVQQAVTAKAVTQARREERARRTKGGAKRGTKRKTRKA